MYGFGGVDLLGPGGATSESAYHLPRSDTAPRTVTLQPGEHAQTVITYLPTRAESWEPTQLLVTPPDETRSLRLSWTYGPVVRQDAATCPGTYIDAVSPR